jgi:hypothetical protein
MKWRKRQQQAATETKETYPPPEENYNPNPNPNEVSNGEYHEMQNQPHPQDEAAEYYNNAETHQSQTWQTAPGMNPSYGQEGQQQQQQLPEDNKKKAIELAKKGWAMYKEHKNKPAA